MSDLVPAPNLCELKQECLKKVRDRLRELDHEVRGKVVSIPSWDRGSGVGFHLLLSGNSNYGSTCTEMD